MPSMSTEKANAFLARLMSWVMEEKRGLSWFSRKEEKVLVFRSDFISLMPVTSSDRVAELDPNARVSQK